MTVTDPDLITTFVVAPSGERFEAQVSQDTELKTLAADFFSAQGWPMQDQQDRMVSTSTAVEEVFQAVTEEYLTINEACRVTPTHPFWSGDDWKRAGELQIGDPLMEEDGSPALVRSISHHRCEATRIYNLYVSSTDHSFFASGLLVHNMSAKSTNVDPFTTFGDRLDKLQQDTSSKQGTLDALHEAIQAIQSRLAVTDDLKRRVERLEDMYDKLAEGFQGFGRALGKIKFVPTGSFEPIKILFLASNPTDTQHLRLDKEVKCIKESLLKKSEYRDRFEFVEDSAVSISDLQEHLLRHRPHIVHFSGHGAESSEVILEGPDGNSTTASVEALAMLFYLLKKNIRCVVLNLCFSAPQADAIAEHIDCVVGMAKEIGDDAAIHFAQAFYRAIGYGESVEKAFELGKLETDLHGLDDAQVPQLIAKHLNPAAIKFV
jgi:acyl carrier protein phosphodiesterase